MGFTSVYRERFNFGKADLFSVCLQVLHFTILRIWSKIKSDFDVSLSQLRGHCSLSSCFSMKDDYSHYLRSFFVF